MEQRLRALMHELPEHSEIRLVLQKLLKHSGQVG